MPIHIIFVTLIVLLGQGEKITLSFSICYLSCVLFQILTLLFLGRHLAKRAWAKDLDPDDHVIPYLNALSDFYGTVSIVILSKVFSNTWLTTQQRCTRKLQICTLSIVVEFDRSGDERSSLIPEQAWERKQSIHYSQSDRSIWQSIHFSHQITYAFLEYVVLHYPSLKLSTSDGKRFFHRHSHNRILLGNISQPVSLHGQHDTFVYRIHKIPILNLSRHFHLQIDMCDKYTLTAKSKILGQLRERCRGLYRCIAEHQ